MKSETSRRVLIIVVLILVLAFGVGQFFAGSLNTAQQTAQNASSSIASTPTTQATQVIVFSPSLPASSMPVDKGSCFASSIAAPYRSDAYRCTVGNAISDPCFVIPSGGANLATASLEPTELACGENPAAVGTSTAFTLELTKPLPAIVVPSSTPSNWAWLVQLADGTICTPFTGTLPFTATGDVAKYGCNGGPTESLVFGDLNNASPTWTAEVGELSTSTKIFPPVIVASATVPVFGVWE